MNVQRTLGAGLAIALGLSLAACAPTVGWPGAGVGGGGSQPGDRTNTPTATATPDPSRTPVAKGETSAPGFGDPQSCLTGTWLADNASWLSGIQQFGDEIKSVDGQVFVTYNGDGGLTTEYVGWLITAVAEGMTVTIAREGTDTGAYTATDTTMSFYDTSMGSTISVSGLGSIAPEPANYGDAPYDCTAGDLTITTVDGAFRMTR